jgi:hypothetical protein
LLWGDWEALKNDIDAYGVVSTFTIGGIYIVSTGIAAVIVLALLFAVLEQALPKIILLKLRHKKMFARFLLCLLIAAIGIPILRREIDEPGILVRLAVVLIASVGLLGSWLLLGWIWRTLRATDESSP